MSAPTDDAVGRVAKELDRQRSWGGMAWVDAPRVSVPTDALRAVLARLAECEARGAVDITKASNVDCYEIRYLVSKVQVHAYKGSDYAGVVGRAIAYKWRETFDAARAGVGR